MAKEEKSGSAWAISGMVALLSGRKMAGLGMFARGLAVLEQGWRAKHPNFQGGFSERWEAATEFYDATHRNKVNRWLHITGIPLIVVGAAGLLAFKPYRPAWTAAAGSFAVGWGLNILGHAAFERNAPAFKDDPLSFIAGPVWDIQQLFGKRSARSKGEAIYTNGVATNGVAAQA